MVTACEINSSPKPSQIRSTHLFRIKVVRVGISECTYIYEIVCKIYDIFIGIDVIEKFLLAPSALAACKT